MTDTGFEQGAGSAGGGAAPPPAPAPPPQPRTYRLHFTGSAGEYFRIWIVNVFLTIVTLGIYAAWAKVRTRRYFHACTRLAGQPFEYLADPKAILKGNLVVAGGAILYAVAGEVNEVLAVAVVLLIFCIFPFLAWKSLRFSAHNSAYRNIRFRFLGTLGDSYRTYLLLPLALPFTLGLLFPYWDFARKRYFHEHMAFGTARARFSGRVGPFYAAYGIALLLLIGAAVPLAAGVGGVAALFGPAQASPGEAAGRIVALAALGYAYLFFLITLAQQVVFARVTRHCYGATRIGGVTLGTVMRARDLVWIRVTNVLAIVLSLGLLAPWARVRRARYVLESIRVHARRDLDEFTAALGREESALGDAAVDFLDMEVGL